MSDGTGRTEKKRELEKRVGGGWGGEDGEEERARGEGGRGLGREEPGLQPGLYN